MKLYARLTYSDGSSDCISVKAKSQFHGLDKTQRWARKYRPDKTVTANSIRAGDSLDSSYLTPQGMPKNPSDYKPVTIK